MIKSIRVAVLVFVSVVGLTSRAAEGATISYPVVGSDTGSLFVTTQHFGTEFLSFSTVFPQFDPALGTLTAATLTFDIGGSVTMTPNIFPQQWAVGSIAFDYAGQTHTVNYDVTGLSVIAVPGPDGTINLALGEVTGTGTFSRDFSGLFSFNQGLLSWNVDGAAAGEFLVTYTYTPSRVVPEPASMLLVGIGVASAGIRRWRQRRA